MALSEEMQKKCMARMLKSRMRILLQNGFYGLLLMHVRYALDSELETACTDGSVISFSPDFLMELSDTELDFVMMHEILHVALRHPKRVGKKDQDTFNIACDIVVNSNILQARDWDLSAITLQQYGESMHITPDGEEGCEYTAEEVYQMLRREGDQDQDAGWDSHDQWEEEAADALEEAQWTRRVMTAAAAMKSQGRDSHTPPAVRRLLEEMEANRLDWKQVLHDFIQEEVTDYSLLPPDRRWGDSPFFLPDFNEREDKADHILFMVDTSASMGDEEITLIYGEILSAIRQFGGRLQGLLGYFDTRVFTPQPFEEVEDVLKNRPQGGGGTSFHAVFDYIREQMQEVELYAILIMTDGDADFPPEEAAAGVPVLWILTNKEIKPPWGRVIYMEGVSGQSD